jgi:hypothetical protein
VGGVRGKVDGRGRRQRHRIDVRDQRNRRRRWRRRRWRAGRAGGPPRAGSGPGEAGAVDRALAAHHHVVRPDKIQKRRGPIALDALPIRVQRREVRHHRRALEDGFLLQLEIHAGFEIKRAAHEDTRRDDQHSATVGRAPVDGGLERLGVDRGAIADCAVFGDNIAADRRGGRGWRRTPPQRQTKRRRTRLRGRRPDRNGCVGLGS